MGLTVRILLLAGIAGLTACASTQSPSSSSGRYLVYRDAGGNPVRQFDYPSIDLCKKVEAIAGRSARCQNDSASSQLQAKATLRYNPPGLMVEGHYMDLARCRVDTGSMSSGVELISACAAK